MHSDIDSHSHTCREREREREREGRGGGGGGCTPTLDKDLKCVFNVNVLDVLCSLFVEQQEIDAVQLQTEIKSSLNVRLTTENDIRANTDSQYDIKRRQGFEYLGTTMAIKDFWYSFVFRCYFVLE